MSESGAIVVHPINAWIEANKADFKPPICNKCMFRDQLKVFFVGGPNSRRDFHFEEGEELFYQLDGDMLLKVMEHGKSKNIVINEGHIFLMPGRVEHSPQRLADTIGFVVERTRNLKELDCIRYFVRGSMQRLYERWFHLEDVVKDLPPVIQEYHRSDAFKTGTPTKDSFTRAPEYEPIERKFDEPICLAEFLQANQKRIQSGTGPVQLYGQPEYKTEVLIYGIGSHQIEAVDGEVLFWQLTGTSEIKVSPDSTEQMKTNCMARLKLHHRIVLILSDTDSTTMTVKMATPVPKYIIT